MIDEGKIDERMIFERKMESYIISIDQSTQGTKALLFDRDGIIVHRVDKSHRQIINEKGWVSHDLEEIYQNVLDTVEELLATTKVDHIAICGVAISNQRETTAVWNKKSEKSIDNAIVWQCRRAQSICERGEVKEKSEEIQRRTGLPLSPYFPAAKIAWLLENTVSISEEKQEEIAFGTMDSWLIYKLTQGKSYKTDYSNASRTQLFNLQQLKWDEKVCEIFGINSRLLPEVCDSDSCFGYTDFQGLLPEKIPICGVLGDSHSALFGQGCLEEGQTKCTYGTGSSIMMNVGEQLVLSENGIASSLAWKIDGRVQYVLEGNLNYTGAVISWLKDDVKLIESATESEDLAKKAIRDDSLYLVPAFSGLGAPYWDSGAKGSYIGMTRTTKKAELVRAALECIAYQITDILKAMSKDAGIDVKDIRVDGGPTRNNYLMEFQSDIANVLVRVPDSEELSAMGVAYLSGITLGIYEMDILKQMKVNSYKGNMSDDEKEKKYEGWLKAVGSVLELSASTVVTSSGGQLTDS
jgi:glycerol kinase